MYQFHILGGYPEQQTGDFVTSGSGYGVSQRLPYPSQSSGEVISASAYRAGTYYIRGTSEIVLTANYDGTTYTKTTALVNQGSPIPFTDNIGSTTTGNADSIKNVIMSPVNKTFNFYIPTSWTINCPTEIPYQNGAYQTDENGDIPLIFSDVVFDLYYVFSYRTTNSNHKYVQNWSESLCSCAYSSSYYNDSVDDYANGVCRFSNIDKITESSQGSDPYGFFIYTYPTESVQSHFSGTPISDACGFYYKSSSNVVMWDTSYPSLTIYPLYTGKAYIKLCFE